MAEPVEWRADGVPYSPRYGDIYHSETGAPEQARHVFLTGCGLPEAWAGTAQWRILETGFGFGLNFLTTWQAWRDDEGRPGLLHFVSVEAHPVSAADLSRAASQTPELQEFAQALAAQWSGLLPGVHRLSFERGRVLLTLCIGDVQPMLRGMRRFAADSIFLDGFSPDRNAGMWSPHTLKAVSRFARIGTRIATWTVARSVRDALKQFGFDVRKAPGHPPKRDSLRGEFAPAWTPLRRPGADDSAVVERPGHCAVVGGGLAGSAVAAQLALRGWRVTVLDAAAQPAAGASGIPVALLAPHVSPDDALLSRLTRAGIRSAWHQLEDRLVRDIDWSATGVLERRSGDAMRLPSGWANARDPDDSKERANESRAATAQQVTDAGLQLEPSGLPPALWHARAGWVKPARLVTAWLATPGVRFVGNSRVAHVERHRDGARDGDSEDAGWILRDAEGAVLAQADRVVIAAGYDSLALAPTLALTPVRGQVTWGHARAVADLRDLAPVPAASGLQKLPATPVNGDGHLIAHVPEAGGELWLHGATFDRNDIDPAPRAADAERNRQQLARLHPAAAALLAWACEHVDSSSILQDDPGRDGHREQSSDLHAWAGVRCASNDRRPLVGPVDDIAAPGLWVSTAMGSRGLTFATLCAELLAARWHGEPLPVSEALAKALDTRRETPRRAA